MCSDLMNAEAPAQYLELNLETHPDTPIVLFWNRAPWHRGQPIDRVLEEHPRRQIIFFPTTSPDVNPQEQVGKWFAKMLAIITWKSSFQSWLTVF